MRHGREPSLLHKMFVRLLPGRYRTVVLNPVGVRGFVTPFRKTRHNFRMRSRAAERLHGTLTVPHRHGPECQMRVDKKSPSRKSRGAHDLMLTEESFPDEHRQILQRANPETRDRCEHSFCRAVTAVKRTPTPEVGSGSWSLRIDDGPGGRRRFFSGTRG